MKLTAEILKANAERHSHLDASEYNPLTGQGSFKDRYKFTYRYRGKAYTVYLPQSMATEPTIQSIAKYGNDFTRLSHSIDLAEDNTYLAFVQLRHKHDFEFWSFDTVKIQDKETKEFTPFRLRLAQRKLLVLLEQMRTDNVPIRVILLKARQWGGSTLVQVYMAWIQTKHRKNWHSAIVAQYESQAKIIRGMYTRLAKLYPKQLGSLTFRPYEGSTKNRIIIERGGIVSVGSAERPDSIRSQDLAMLHMSEVGLWATTEKKGAEDLAQSLRGALTDVPLSVCVMESTAKGVGNFFHREWIKASKGESNYRPCFIPWFDIDLYRHSTEQITTEYGSLQKFVDSWAEYEALLWEMGATIEGIAWYRWKLRDMGGDTWRMQAEFPSTAQEAFQSTGSRVFAPAYVANLRRTVKKPIAVGNLVADATRGPQSLQGIRFEPEPQRGKLWIWRWPDEIKLDECRYQTCAFADVGGRTETADKSTVTIIDRYWMSHGGAPEVVAEYRGNLDQDLFAWDAVRLAKWYHDALLAVEVNSLRSEKAEDGEHSVTVLDQIKHHYDNLFTRISPDKRAQGGNWNYVGFHTNSATKEMIIDALNASARDNAYIERSERLCNEMDTYERKPDGKMGAVEGGHDDLVISRAGAVWLALEHMPPPEIMIVETKKRQPKRKTEAMI